MKTKLRKLRDRALVELGRGAPVEAEQLELRATPGGPKLSGVDRDQLLADAVARKAVSLIIDLRAYEQGRRDDKGNVLKNRKGVRVRSGAMMRLGGTARGVPYMRDHRQGDSTAKGGWVLDARSVKLTEDGHYEVLATVNLTEPSAVERALRGLMRAVSVGLEALGPVRCTACKTEIFTRCFHFPFDVVKFADGTEHEVEWEYEEAGIVEISEVPIGAVHHAGLTEIRAALSAVLEEDDETNPATPEETHDMDPKLLELLGLSATASPAEITAAVQAKLNAAAADKATLAIVQSDLAGFRTQLDALQADQRKRNEDTFIADALATGRIAKGDEEHWRALHQADAKRAGELMGKRAAGSATPVGLSPQRADEPTEDDADDRGDDGGGESGVRQLTITGGDIPGGLYIVPERSREERRQLARALAAAVKTVETHPNPAARWWAERCGFDGRLRGPTARLSATAIANDADLAASRVGFTAAFMQALEQAKVDPLEMFYTTVPTSTPDQVINWMGDLPGFEEWDGDRKLAGLEAFKLTLASKKWANGIRIKNDDIKFDRLGLLPQQINGLAVKGRRHRYDRMMQMLVNGFDGAVFPLVSTGLAYDGAFFFSDSHATGDNKLTSALDATALGAAELLLESQTTYDGNDPLEIHGTTLAVGPKLRVTAEKLLTQERLANGEDNYHRGKYKLLVSNRIRSTWDDYWFLADLSHEIKPFGFQLVEDISTSAVIGQAQNSSVPAFINDELWFGAQAHYNMFYFEFRTTVGSQV